MYCFYITRGQVRDRYSVQIVFNNMRGPNETVRLSIGVNGVDCAGSL